MVVDPSRERFLSRVGFALAWIGVTVAPPWLLNLARLQRLFGWPWADQLPDPHALIQRILLLHLVLLAIWMTGALLRGSHRVEHGLRRGLNTASSYAVLVAVAGLVLAFFDAAHAAMFRELVFAGRIVLLPVGIFQGYGIIRIYRSLENHLSHERHMSAQFYKHSTTDPLTNLPNRLLFSTLLSQAIARASRTGGGIAILCLDVDRLKMVNDSLGHEGGDATLQEIARRLKGSLRQADVLCRAGGDEFLLFAEGIATREQLASLMDRLFAEIERPLQVMNVEVSPTVSVGASFYPADGSDPAALVRNADQAMYTAKEAGRNVVAFYRPDLHPVNSERLRLEGELRRALRQGELFLEYQPLVDAKAERIVGLEALVRWNHPTRGRVSPGEFIPIAEDSAIIVALDRWVIRHACARFAQWRKMGFTDLRLAINVSARSFYRDDLVPGVVQALQEHDVPGEMLDLEITESVLLRQSPEVTARLDSLKQLGASIVIDDFGTGHASLGYLNQFPVDAIKLDRGLAIQAGSNPRSAAIVAGVVTIGQALGLRVVGEGVETIEQLAALRRLGCHLIQGFLFSRPADPARILELIREQERVGRILPAAG